MLKAGIIGLPNVGKSTLFNALTNSYALAANYPFATIEPNIGIVSVIDERVDYLAKIYNPKKKTYTTFNFIDIAGLVKGASQGEGLGNQFLANIRTSDAIVHVVRAFIDEDIIHVNGVVNPIDDINTINIELKLADMEVINKRLDKIGKRLTLQTPEMIMEINLLNKVLAILNSDKFFDQEMKNFSGEELDILSNYQLLSSKPVIYVFNVLDEQISNLASNPFYDEIIKFTTKNNLEYSFIASKLESELIELSSEERKLYLQEFQITESSLEQVVKKTYAMLGLRTFLTCGSDECRSWTFKAGMNARACSGIIHSDFEKGFIKAEVLSFSDLQAYGSMANAKAQGKLRIEGKDYLMADGDIVLFRFNL
ncbi:MAG: redox-regulated ATPase YchF [Acholeplasmatales bacterium]|jgi:GTP-binding protein YchF|nr:redox-regulated ATPase YchF [Acholeplasmatales bacterium]